MIWSWSTLFGQIVINEFSAANYDSFQDNYGEYHDWIEIYNNSSNSIDLDGWYLSDKASNLTKWQFPASFILGANTTALIYCSGRDELIGGIAHTNFKITQTKGNEVFVISDPSSNIIDSITVVPHQKTHSRGRDVNGGTNWSVFATTSSPGTNNNGALLEYATTDQIYIVNPNIPFHIESHITEIKEVATIGVPMLVKQLLDIE